MNTTNILAVADAIEQHTIPWLGFNMGPFFAPAGERDEDDIIPDRSGHNCGTVACIAGHAAVLAAKATKEPKTSIEADEAVNGAFLSDAANWLGLDYSFAGVARALFFAEGASVYRCDITADQAVRTLRHLAATGEVDWTV